MNYLLLKTNIKNTLKATIDSMKKQMGAPSSVFSSVLAELLGESRDAELAEMMYLYEAEKMKDEKKLKEEEPEKGES